MSEYKGKSGRVKPTPPPFASSNSLPVDSAPWALEGITPSYTNVGVAHVHQDMWVGLTCERCNQAAQRLEPCCSPTPTICMPCELAEDEDRS